MALCKAPRVVFLDEPTSGLDAASAASVMQFLKGTAARTGIAVLCTIGGIVVTLFAVVVNFNCYHRGGWFLAVFGSRWAFLGFETGDRQ